MILCSIHGIKNFNFQMKNLVGSEIKKTPPTHRDRVKSVWEYESAESCDFETIDRWE